MVGHFFKHAQDILIACKAYMDGAQVGCLVRGGVQDVDEGDKSCSPYFKSNLGVYMKTLVNAFKQIGVKDCDKFIPAAPPAPVAPSNWQSRHTPKLGMLPPPVPPPLPVPKAVDYSKYY